MRTLPQAATAPLWVEVVRLVLEQGEIDDLTQQALERLMIPFPQEAVPLWAEIAARSPSLSAVDVERFQAAQTHWTAIARARRLRKSDVRAAAQALVKAWDGFFASMETHRDA